MFLFVIMKSKILPILLSNILVAAVVWYAASPSVDPTHSLLAAKDKEIQELKDELAKNRSRNSRNSEFARARRQQNQNSDTAAPAENETARAERRQAMAQQVANFRKLHTNATISRLALRLNLSEEQKAQLLARAEERSAEIQTLMEQMRTARESGENVEALQARMRELMQGNNPENYIAEFLSEEQKSEYANYQQERATARAETQANMSLAMIQEAVPLTREQKDKYFSEYAAAALQGNISIEEQNRILKNILSAEQYSAYEEQQQAFQSMRPIGGRNGGGFGRNRGR